MSSVSLNSNLASLGAQRRLADHTKKLGDTYRVLASGSRINSASDDAAGLAVASRLNLDARVFSQGMRNINDGVSALSVAEGSLHELSSITMRQKELAEQAANGSYSVKQRRALNNEMNQLVDEFNRILGATSFNRFSLLTGQTTSLHVQAGYGVSGGVDTGLANNLLRTVGTGGFNSNGVMTEDVVTTPSHLTTGDFNSDGHIDLLESAATGSSLHFGVGDGTFGAGSAVTANYVLATADFNGDNKLDFLSDNGVGSLVIELGIGDGTFKAATGLGINASSGVTIADVNGDGRNDVFVLGASGGVLLLGNGNGTFRGTWTDNTISGGIGTVADWNGDGQLDLGVVDGMVNFRVYFGNGNGTFSAGASTVIVSSTMLASGDFNRDGYADIAEKGAGFDIAIWFGSGSGTFSLAQTLATANSALQLSAGDFNGDGITDLAGAAYGSNFNILLGNADGSFKLDSVLPVAGNVFAIADLDEDSVLDLAISNYLASEITLCKGGRTQVTTAAYYNICTPTGGRSALIQADATLQRINNELASIGAGQSRLESALKALTAARENSVAAGARITDADIGETSSTLVRTQILQQASAAVLAQANQSPALAIKLLTG